jgi:phenylacetic acid degradation operon negative regulatory protein
MPGRDGVVGVKARALVFDLFGDYLRGRDGAVRLRGLVALMDCFGVPESTVRVAVTRLRKEGWLTSRRDGRETTYLLTEDAWRLLDERRSRLFHRGGEAWDGQWRMAIYSVPESERALREQLRKQLSWLGFGPLSSSVWVSPRDTLEQLRAHAEHQPAIRLDIFHTESEGRAADLDIAARAWDLTALDRGYARLLDHYRPLLPGYRAGTLTDRDALVERMRLLHDYRMYPLRDPDLPAELLPAGWPGPASHQVFLEAHELLRAPAEAWVDQLLGVSAGSPV